MLTAEPEGLWSFDEHEEAWANFVLSIDPERLERERFPMPGPDERPGSRAEREEMRRHNAEAAEFRIRRDHPSLTRAEQAVLVAECAAYDESQTYAARCRARNIERKAS